MGPSRGPSATIEEQQATHIQGETIRMVNFVGKGANQQYETKPGDAYAT